MRVETSYVPVNHQYRVDLPDWGWRYVVSAESVIEAGDYWGRLRDYALEAWWQVPALERLSAGVAATCVAARGH